MSFLTRIRSKHAFSESNGQERNKNERKGGEGKEKNTKTEHSYVFISPKKKLYRVKFNH